jgi:hypothetical protein
MKNCIALLIVLCLAAPVWAQAADQKEGVGVTVYNGGYGVVREVRSLDIGADGVVMFKDVAEHIDPTTVHFKSLTDPAAKLREQNYQFDLVSADKLLKKYIDQPIDVICKDKTYSGTLLSFDAGQIVLKEKEGVAMVQRADNVRDIRFKDLPGGLLTRPTLVWLVTTDKPGKHLSEVTYQTGNVNWHAEYVLVVNPDDTKADLAGWVSFENNSGKTYTNAKLKFIAGDVHRAPEPRLREAGYGGGRGGAPRPAAAAMEEKAFFEYHMYTLPRPSTVADNEVKQLEMFDPVSQMKISKKYLYEPMSEYHFYPGNVNQEKTYGVTSPKKVAVFVEFKNAKENHPNLGIPLPAGKVRVFKQDQADKALEFVGEERIDHTPKDEELSLQVGNAFDLVGEWKQTDFYINTGGKIMRETIEVKLRNHKAEDVTIRVKVPMHRSKNWKMLDSKVAGKDFEFKKLDASTVAFDVPVPAKKDGKEGSEEAVLTFQVEYTW